MNKKNYSSTKSIIMQILRKLLDESKPLISKLLIGGSFSIFSPASNAMATQGECDC